MNKTLYPGYRTMSAAQRYNARLERIFEQARANGAFDKPTEGGKFMKDPTCVLCDEGDTDHDH